MIDTLLTVLMATLMSGDLLFVSDTNGMGQAVQQTTGIYSHVAIVERSGDSLFLIDATPTHGVARRPLTYDLLTPTSNIAVYRLAVPFDTAAVVARAHAFVGQPYDDYFLPDNNRLYCSELIYECYLDADGRHLFPTRPMNWRNADGQLPVYWLEHFNNLGVPVPEGVAGTNPTDLSHSPLLKKMQ